MTQNIIREMKFEDIPLCVTFWRTTDAPSYVGVTQEEAISTDTRYIQQVFGKCLESRSSFVSVAEGRVTGVAVGLGVPLIFQPGRVDLYLLALSSNKNITTAKLFKKWHENALTLNYNRVLVDSIFSTNFNYEKLGYKKLRETYYMET